uniref:Uncharacterized protein n=1 Tax=Timema poppense TaxID=170557 RepID=A0A7R9DPF9_TIMPO|nr:unnamed protein product [Timema poppensis]
MIKVQQKGAQLQLNLVIDLYKELHLLLEPYYLHTGFVGFLTRRLGVWGLFTCPCSANYGPPPWYFFSCCLLLTGDLRHSQLGDVPTKPPLKLMFIQIKVNKPTWCIEILQNSSACNPQSSSHVRDKDLVTLGSRNRISIPFITELVVKEEGCHLDLGA